MKRKIFFYIFFFLFSFTISLIFSAEKIIQLNKINYYPKKKNDYFFYPLPDLHTNIENNKIYLYAVENFGHKVLKFSIDKNLNLKLIKIIGRPGQGPGDLNLPVSISIDKGEIAVKDNIAFSFFNIEGKFLRKFKTFSGKESFFYLNNKIYWLNFNPEEKHLVEIRSNEGKKLKTFGKKFISLDFSIFKGLSPFRVEDHVYEGNLLYHNGIILYVNRKFGDLIKFNIEGRELKRKNITGFFGNYGAKMRMKNNELWIERGLDLAKTKRRIPIYNIFKDAYICKNKLYLISRNWYPKLAEERVNKRVIIALDVNSLNFVKKYEFWMKKFDRIVSFSIIEVNNKPVFFVQVRTEEGDYINVYK